MAATDPAMPPGTVLVVEDEALVAFFLADLLGELGQTVIGPATTIEAALRAAEETPPEIAVVDVNLGRRGSGIELAQKLRQVYGTAIIFLSGQSGLSADPGVRSVSPSAILEKPCLPSDLEAALRAAKSANPPNAG